MSSVMKMDGPQISQDSLYNLKSFMSNKEFIDEVTVSDRISSMTNPRTNDSLKTAEAVGEGCLQGSRLSVVIVPEKRKRYSTQEKMELVRLTYLPGNTVSSVARAHGVAPAVLFFQMARSR